MKAIITSYGDKLAGLRDQTITIDIPGQDTEKWMSWMDVNSTKYKSARELFRAKLQRFWAGYLDSRPVVLFDDECPDCGKQTKPVADIGSRVVRVCSNKNCISTMPEEKT